MGTRKLSDLATIYASIPQDQELETLKTSGKKIRKEDLILALQRHHLKVRFPLGIPMHLQLRLFLMRDFKTVVVLIVAVARVTALSA